MEKTNPNIQIMWGNNSYNSFQQISYLKTKPSQQTEEKIKQYFVNNRFAKLILYNQAYNLFNDDKT